VRALEATVLIYVDISMVSVFFRLSELKKLSNQAFVYHEADEMLRIKQVMNEQNFRNETLTHCLISNFAHQGAIGSYSRSEISQ